jgi:hypothetical protein
VQVTDDGDLIYTIPSNSRQALTVHNAELRTEAALRAAGDKAVQVVKFGFAGELARLDPGPDHTQLMRQRRVVVCGVAGDRT